MTIRSRCGAANDTYRASPSPAAEPVGEMRFSDEAIHLVTGGFGAIGRRLAQWLAARGARHIALTSRRGDATPGARELTRDLESRGAKVYAIAADVGDATGVDKLFTELTRMGRPLGAVFHIAGVDHPQPFASSIRRACARCWRRKQ